MELEFNTNQKEQENFTLNIKDVILNICQLYISNQVIFHVVFPDGKPPLVLTRATTHEQQRFWTSIPQGRQKEAEEIGTLIAEHILSSQS